MTHKAPLLTLLAVAALGGGLLATNYVVTPVPAAGPAPAAVSAQAAPVADRQTGTVPVPGVVVAVPAPAAPEPPAAPEETRALPEEIAYSGWTDGRRMTVAVVVTGDEAVAYVCDADDEVWLRGSAADGELDLENADGTAALSGTATADGATGTVTVDGADWAFTADATSVDDALAAGREDVADVADRAGVAY
jgi:hypothetical protein